MTIQEEFEVLVDDGRWWERQPFVFDDQNVRDCVLDPERAVEQLKVLYDADTCIRLVRTASGRLILPLFLGGFVPEIDEYVQLGADLAECAGWISKPKLVADLRSEHAYEGARFEIGVWAGLARVGLTPQVEPAPLKSSKRPDFVVSVDGLRVAIELKGLADPVRERNLEALHYCLAQSLTHRFHDRWSYDVTVFVSDELQVHLAEAVDQFAMRLPALRKEFEAHQEHFELNARVSLPALGIVQLASPSAETGSLELIPDELDDRALLFRALSKVRNASDQLGAVEVDLRIAVVWGSRQFLPASWAAENAAAVFQGAPADWNVSADWVVFYNAHTLGERPGLTIEIESAPLPHARAAIPPKILEALRGWNLRRRAVEAAG